MKFVRSMYDWVLSWAETPYGGMALFLIAFCESSFFPIPPDVLLIALCIGKRERALYFALICSVGSVLGGIAGYAIGWGVWALVDDLFFNYVPGFSPEGFNQVQDLYAAWDFWIIFVAAFTPIPYKIITIAAGVFGVSIVMFVIATIIGRSARFFLVAGLLHYFGPAIRDFIDRRFNLLTVVFTLLLIGGFAVLRLIGH